MHNKLSCSALFELLNYLLPISCKTGLNVPTFVFPANWRCSKPSRIDDIEKYHITKICLAGNQLNVTKKFFLLLADSYKYYFEIFFFDRIIYFT